MRIIISALKVVGAFCAGLVFFLLLALFSSVLALVLAGILAASFAFWPSPDKRSRPYAWVMLIIAVILAPIAFSDHQRSSAEGQAAKLAELKTSDPQKYLVEIKPRLTPDQYMAELKAIDPAKWAAEIRGRDGMEAWIEALKEVDPASYAIEAPKWEATKANEAKLLRDRELATVAENERIAKLRRPPYREYLAAIKGRPEYLDELRALDPAGYSRYQAEQQKIAAEAVKATQRAGSALQVTNWGWSKGHGYATVEGQVRNLTDQPINNLVAVVSFYTADGRFISAGDALIEYRPLLPSQASPFKVLKSWNPEMNKAQLEFKLFGGRTIKHFEGK